MRERSEPAEVGRIVFDWLFSRPMSSAMRSQAVPLAMSSLSFSTNLASFSL